MAQSRERKAKKTARREKAQAKGKVLAQVGGPGARELAVKAGVESLALLRLETDRGCMLVAGAILDELIGEVIAALVVSEAAAKKVIGSPGLSPAGMFGHRITIAHAIGGITEVERNSLERVKSIRNAAAHFHKRMGLEVSFGAVDIQKWVDELRPVDALENIPSLAREVEQRRRFENFVREMCFRLRLRTFLAPRIKEPPEPGEVWEALRDGAKSLRGGEFGSPDTATAVAGVIAALRPDAAAEVKRKLARR